MPARFASHLSSASVPLSGEQTVYGRTIGVQSLIESFWTYGRSGSYQLFFTADPMSGECPARDFLNHVLKPRPGKCADVRDVQFLKANFDQFNFETWHDFDADMQLAATMRGRLSRRLYPITSTVHVLSYQGLLEDWLLGLLLEPLYECDAIVCSTNSCRKALANLLSQVAGRFNAEFGTSLRFAGQLAMVPLAVDTEEFRPGRRNEARSNLGLPENAFIIGWVGRITPVDKADLIPLLEVFSRLVKANPHRPLLLVLAGSGPEQFRNALLQCAAIHEISEKVRLISPLPAASRADVHAALDVFTSPADNLQETAGITPLEAMASGVPQVVSDWNGYRESVGHGETGFLVPTFWSRCDDDIGRHSGLYDEDSLMDHYASAQSVALDLRALEQAFQTLLDNDPLRAQMGAASRRRAIAGHGPEGVVGLYEELWDGLAQIARNTPFQTHNLPRYNQAEFFHAFQHYPSVVVSDNALIVVTEIGAAVREGSRPLPFYYEMIPGLTKEALGVTLGLIREPDHFEASVICVARALGVSESAARRHILWLLKQGLIEIRS